MLKLLHKKHMGKAKKGVSFVIYYSALDIILGLLLLSLVSFFAIAYVNFNLYGSDTTPQNITHQYPVVGLPKK